jgi:hypothetical protein
MYKNKYLKYKNKYLQYKKMIGGDGNDIVDFEYNFDKLNDDESIIIINEYIEINEIYNKLFNGNISDFHQHDILNNIKSYKNYTCIPDNENKHLSGFEDQIINKNLISGITKYIFDYCKSSINMSSINNFFFKFVKFLNYDNNKNKTFTINNNYLKIKYCEDTKMIFCDNYKKLFEFEIYTNDKPVKQSL